MQTGWVPISDQLTLNSILTKHYMCFLGEGPMDQQSASTTDGATAFLNRSRKHQLFNDVHSKDKLI